MTFVCAHQEFAEAVNHPAHGLICRGNVMSNTQASTYVRRIDDTRCNGHVFAPGLLRNFVLAFFGLGIPASVDRAARLFTQEQAIIVYRFSHWRGQTRIEHGWLITDTNHRALTRCVTGPTWKSRAALEAAEAVIVSGGWA